VNFLERAILSLFPSWGRSRAQARLAARHYEAASTGRRTDGWYRLGTDANAAAGGGTLSRLRAQGRDLVRNNPWARRGLRRIVTNTVGWGIRPRPTGKGGDLILQRWKDWAETTDCDAAGRLTMYGLQALAMRTVVRDGEVLIRRRMRRPDDGLAVPMQLQILEPDYLDASRDGIIGDAGGPIIQGVEFDAIGRRAAYWLFDRHPGSLGAFGSVGAPGRVSPVSKRYPADGILHVYEQERPGQVRGASWFASVDMRLHDFDEFEDATLVKQRIAASMAVFVTDVTGDNPNMAFPGTDRTTGAQVDTFEPGMIIPLQPGKQVQTTNPPAATDHQSYSVTLLRSIAAGLGTTYEDLTGDFSQTNYSSGRMGRIGMQSDVEDWRWNMLIPQFCVPSWEWMLDAMILAGDRVEQAPAEWHPAPMPILEPAMELKAYQEAVRNGFMSWPQVVRELGYDPREQLAEIIASNKALDAGDVVLDCDPRHTNAQGQAQDAGSSDSAPAADAGGAAPAPKNGAPKSGTKPAAAA
jgi:lambda family phage portal protein